MIKKPPYMRYIWQRDERERDGDRAYWPGMYGDLDKVFKESPHGRFYPGQYATLKWFGGQRFFSLRHYKFRDMP